MAKFLLGALVTNIAGSIGGTTFRRVPNGLSMFNKIRGTSKSRLLQNNRLPEIGQIFQRWSLLSDTERAGWNAQALLVTFPDKFGNQKNLTGRELFSKVNIQSLPAGFSITDSTGFTTETIPFTFTLLELDVTGELIGVTITSEIESGLLLVSMEVSNKQIFQPTFKSRKVIGSFATSSPDQAVPITSQVMSNFPYLQAGMWVAVYIQTINEFGILSPYQYMIGQAV